MKDTSAFNTPEKGTSRRDNPPLLPPPRKPTSKLDNGTAPHKGFGTGGGHYPRYRTAEAMEYAINLYFAKKTEEGRPFTMAGLALSIGFRSAKTLKDYEERGEDYASVIEIARSRVEEWKNELLLEGGRATNGVIFDLKNNHGWTDRVETKTTHEVGGTLADLVLALQGKVLRPNLINQPDDEIEGVFFEENYEGSIEDLIASDYGVEENPLDTLEAIDYENLI